MTNPINNHNNNHNMNNSINSTNRKRAPSEDVSQPQLKQSLNVGANFEAASSEATIAGAARSAGAASVASFRAPGTSGRSFSNLLPIAEPAGSIEPTVNDVLFGRGRSVYERAANKVYIDEILRHQSSYKGASKLNKKLICQQVVARVVERLDGRFLFKDINDRWCKADDEMVQRKVNHALREDYSKEARAANYAANKAKKMAAAGDVQNPPIPKPAKAVTCSNGNGQRAPVQNGLAKMPPASAQELPAPVVRAANANQTQSANTQPAATHPGQFFHQPLPSPPWFMLSRAQPPSPAASALQNQPQKPSPNTTQPSGQNRPTALSRQDSQSSLDSQDSGLFRYDGNQNRFAASIKADNARMFERELNKAIEADTLNSPITRSVNTHFRSTALDIAAHYGRVEMAVKIEEAGGESLRIGDPAQALNYAEKNQGHFDNKGKRIKP